MRYRVKNVGTDNEPLFLLLEVTYLPGRIERRCFQLDENGARREVALDAWVGATLASPDVGYRATQASPLQAVTLTGIPSNTITWLPNGLVRGQPVSDYDGAIELQDALNAKNSQVGRVLLKHSDPRMAFPAEAFDPVTGDIRSDHDVFAYGPEPERVPRYITWDAELQSAMADRALVRTETSQVLLGMKQGAAPDAYKKVRLEAFNSLTKAARKAAYWTSAIRRAVSVAQELENVLPGGPRYERKPIGVHLRDGIPMDDKEQAERLSILRSAGLVSLQRAIEEQLQDPAAASAELARLTSLSLGGRGQG